MADPMCGEGLLGLCTGMGEAWPAVSNEEPYPKGKLKNIERLMAKGRQACQLDGERIEGTIPSGGYQRRMGGLYRVGVSGAREDLAAGRSIETPLETSYN